MSEILGNEQAKSQAVTWLKKWKPGTKPLLLYGAPGTGKTTLAHVLAEELNYNLIELNTSDQRTEEKINQIAGRASQNISLEQIFKKSKGTIIFFDEVDGIYGREDYGGVAAILKIIEESAVPVLLAANSIEDAKIAAIVHASQPVQMHGMRMPLLVAFLRHICKKEGVKADDEAMKLIAKNSRGDVRSALNDLQMYARDRVLKTKEVVNLSERRQTLDLQETLTQLVTAKSMAQARAILNSSDTPLYKDEVLLTIHDNLPYIYRDQPGRLSAAYQTLSDADIILKRIKNVARSNWHLIPYLLETLSLLFISNPAQTPPPALSYPPQKIIQMGRTKKERFIRGQIAAKIKTRCHLSTRASTTEILPYLRMLHNSDRKKAQQIQRWLALTEEEAGYMKKP